MAVKAPPPFDPKAFLAKVGEGRSIARYPKDRTVFSQGEPADAVFYIQKGKVSRLNPAVRDPIPYYMVMLDRVRAMASQFDVLHFHIDHLHFPIFHGCASRTLTTLHGRQDLPYLMH